MGNYGPGQSSGARTRGREEAALVGGAADQRAASARNVAIVPRREDDGLNKLSAHGRSIEDLMDAWRLAQFVPVAAVD